MKKMTVRWTRYAPTCVTPGVTASGHSMSMSMNTKSASIRIKEHQLSPISINKHNQYNSMRMSMSIKKKIYYTCSKSQKLSGTVLAYHHKYRSSCRS